ncbi:MAG: hypothetical protein ABIQ12_08245 [Opitutaceae bacterium]
MGTNLDRQKFVENALASIAVMPHGTKVDALLACFSGLLDSMEVAAIREKRDQLMERFSHCGGSFEACSLVVKWLDCQIALRGCGRAK